MRGLSVALFGVLLSAPIAFAQPANDNCASAQTVFAGLPAATGTNVAATTDGPVPSCVAGNGPDVWYRYVTTPGSGPVTIDTCGSNFDTVLTVYLTTCNGTQIDCNDDGATCGPTPFRQSRIVINNPSPGGGDVLFIRVHGFNGVTGNITLNINTCAPQILSTTGGGNTCGQAFRTVSVLATGTNPTYQWFQTNLNQPIPDTNSPELTVPVSGIGPITYLCRVTTACGSPAFSQPITFNNNEFPVFTTNLPTNLLACSGQPTTLEVAATGGDNSFQWKKGNDEIPGANSSTFAIEPLSENSGVYSCVVTNTCGTNTSQLCNVTINGPTLTVPGQFATIQAAINALPDCGRVLVSPGTYAEHLTLGTRRVRLESTGGPAVTFITGTGANAGIIDSNNLSADLAGSSVTGFTIANGRGTSTGSITFGGGISIVGAGGSNDSPFTVENCVITGNRANLGGGIAAIDANLRLINCTISENRATGLPNTNPRGAGLALLRASVSADRCTFSNNIAINGSGAGINIEVGTPTGSRFSNCLIHNNVADTGSPSAGGGGARITEASVRFLNCTIARNGGGQGTALRLESLANVTLINSIIAQNGENTPVFFTGVAPLSSYCFIQPDANFGVGGIGNIIAANPGFSGVNTPNFRLGPTSPCVDAGSANTNTPDSFTFDRDGAPRVVDDPTIADTGSPGPGTSTQDIGAFERQPNPTDACPQGTLLAEGSHLFSTVGASTDGPDETGVAPCGADDRFLNDVWFRYIPSCTGTAIISLCDSFFDTEIAVYRGEICPNSPGSVAVCNDDSDCGLPSQVSLPVAAGEILLVRIAGFNGIVGNGVVNISCTPTPTCPVDINGDGNVDPDDLADAIACFFGTDCTLDINLDMNEDPDDLADYIALFFGGCP